MDRAEHFYRFGMFSPAAMDRFARLWAWSTATEHPMTRHASLKRWGERRERIRRAVRAIIANA
ncbi:hypothetical protein [Ancylobacter amanitiformis]|uniref:Uncharacterized protein n=1 Tax=Ancylobacter amanitiformis TaxID=217069 RepID=A0ABU0LQN1_9HYPH|nr:hypothetical protein [Ancylobacter amanitiformis]MDQ0510898.1 hypothetical protein [Ancylobacter amanitiformis]